MSLARSRGLQGSAGLRTGKDITMEASQKALNLFWLLCGNPRLIFQVSFFKIPPPPPICVFMVWDWI